MPPVAIVTHATRPTPTAPYARCNVAIHSTFGVQPAATLRYSLDADVVRIVARRDLATGGPTPMRGEQGARELQRVTWSRTAAPPSKKVSESMSASPQDTATFTVAKSGRSAVQRLHQWGSAPNGGNVFHVIAHTNYGWRGMGIINPAPAIVATRTTERAARKLSARLASMSCSATTYTVRPA